MSLSAFLFLYGPLLVLAPTVLWGLGRVLYLKHAKDITVLSFMSQKKTPAELGLAVIAISLNSYLFLRPFISGLDQKLLAFSSSYPIWGFITMITGMGLMVVSQARMGGAWRIGVPKERETSQTLVTSGLYRYSRNPIYIGIMLFLLGTVLTIPGPVTILSLIGTFLLLHPIIKREEASMAAIFGTEYATYCHEVRRWL